MAAIDNVPLKVRPCAKGRGPKDAAERLKTAQSGGWQRRTLPACHDRSLAARAPGRIEEEEEEEEEGLYLRIETRRHDTK